MFDIQAVSHEFSDKIQAEIDGKTKRFGALGDLELLAKKIAQIQLTGNAFNAPDNDQHKLRLNSHYLTFFTGDQGIASEVFSIAPSDVTSQKITNFANGGDAINVFFRQFGWQLGLVDAAILHPFMASKSSKRVINKATL